LFIAAGVEVTAISAHHCPGAAVFLFRLENGKKYIHCGDMRYQPCMKENEHLQQFVNPDAVFLDTTYCHPKHTFPSQQESVDAIASLCATYAAENIPKRCAQCFSSARRCL
jgi:DNA ligase-1